MLGFYFKDWSMEVILGFGIIVASLISKIRQKKMEKSGEPASDPVQRKNS